MPKVLVVDDDPEFEEFCRLHVDKGPSRFRFFFAHDDEEAMAILASRGDLDLALVSIDGGAHSGMGLFRKLTGSNVRMPRIAITRKRDLVAIRQAMNQGAADFLNLPVSCEEITETIDRVFGICQDRRRAWKNEARLSALRKEVEIAREIQRRILPNRFPSGDKLEVYSRMEPAREMGGDFFDFFEMTPGRFCLFVADVSGKGIPAAFGMAVAQSLTRATAHACNGQPGACVQRVNELLCRHNAPGLLVSLFFAIIDADSGQMTYTNAGHPLPWLIPGDGGPVRPLGGGEGVIVGVLEDLEYPQETMTLAPGDLLFIYTDGLTEAFNERREQFGDKRLNERLAACRQSTPVELVDRVFLAVKEHAGSTAQWDDLTGFALKRLPSA